MGGRHVRAAVVLAALLGVVASSCADDARRSSSQALYRALLTSAIPDSQLTHAFYAARNGVGTPSWSARRHHAAGRVDVDVDRGGARIVYTVYRSTKDALADWKDANSARRADVKSRLAAPGFPVPAIVVNGSAAGKDAFGKKLTKGFSDLGFVAGSVIVHAVTLSVVTTDSGDVPNTFALGKIALRHLREVEARVGRS